MKINFKNLTEKQYEMFKEVNTVLNFTEDKDGYAVIVNTDENQADSIKIEFKDNDIEISLKEDRLFPRSLTLIKNGVKEKKTITEKNHYEKLEGFFDCSRNAVTNIPAFKELIKQFALMGYTGIQLYIEDTYEIEGYPYFGYLRGAYTKDELKEMDEYCLKFDIELIPCIQTLAHLGKALRWSEFAEYTDCDDILLAGDERTYKLIEAMVKAVAEGLTSRRINICFDEAHLLGLGKYLAQHGFQDRLKIMLDHLNRVRQITDKYGYELMMWSDMFFRLLNNGEYENDVEVTEEQRAMIPQDVTLVYWNYYSTDKSIYDSLLKSHFKMSDKIAFAAAAWKFSGFGPHNTYSISVGRLSNQSCLENNIKHIIVTTWGDDGGEASMFSILPSFALWAEFCYKGECDDSLLKERFEATCNENYEDYMALDRLINTPENQPQPSLDRCGSYPNKYILYQDVLYGMFDKHISPETAPHFAKTAEILHNAAKSSKYPFMFESLAKLADAVALKGNCGIELRAAYKAKDKTALKNYADNILPELLNKIEVFYEEYTAAWLKENKVFGLDMFDIRIGALKQRILRAISRVNDYLAGRINIIEELEQEILYYDCRKQDGVLAVNEPFWLNIVSPSVSRRDTKY